MANNSSWQRLRLVSYVPRMIAGLLALFQLTMPYAQATAVAILANTNEIVVAADSKVYGSDEKLCKIFQIGSVYWAMSGVMNNTTTGYDVSKIVKASYLANQGVAKILDEFMKNVDSPLKQTLADLNKSQVIFTHPLDIAFWSFENGRPVIASVEYSADYVDGKVTVTPSRKSVFEAPADSRVTEVLVLGVRAQAAPYANAHKELAENLESAARKLVTISIHDEPETVGYPINELVIRRDGYRWITPNTVCHSSLCEGTSPSQ